ncbi:MAG: membrane or secreted protein [Pirellulales bacterium]
MNSPSKFWCLIFVISGLSMSSGCRNLARPQWFNPGTMEQQQLRAMRYDPYPDVDAGPEMVGVRPRGFDRPAPEATKSQPSAFWGQ